MNLPEADKARRNNGNLSFVLEWLVIEETYVAQPKRH